MSKINRRVLELTQRNIRLGLSPIEARDIAKKRWAFEHEVNRDNSNRRPKTSALGGN